MGLLTNEEDFRYDADVLRDMNWEQIRDELCHRALDRYEEKEALFGEEVFREVERAVLLRNVDTAWMEHIDIMDDLKGSVGLQSYAQRDPVNEYRIQGAELFDNMVSDIRHKTVRTILSVVPRAQPIQRVQVANPIVEGFEGMTQKRMTVTRRPSATVVKDGARVGRNDPCPCGSGKKYKNCCMRTNGEG
jgi:preprotein translocase subunit SecA